MKVNISGYQRLDGGDDVPPREDVDISVQAQDSNTQNITQY